MKDQELDLPTITQIPAIQPTEPIPPLGPNDPLPQRVLLMGDKDQFGRPRSLSIEQAIAQLGEPGARVLAQGDRTFCGQVDQLRRFNEMNDQIRKAEEEIRQAERMVQVAITGLQKQLADEVVAQRRFRVADLILSGIQIALGFGIKAPAAYQALIAVGGVQNATRGWSYARLTELNLAWIEVYGQVMQNYDRRLETYDLRLQIYTGINAFWILSMGNWCTSVGHVLPPAVQTNPLPAPLRPMS
ncbi:MAG: hypothetical protein Q7R54_00500 [bacterium]|nr:hypothetical protein [bacterium]